VELISFRCFGGHGCANIFQRIDAAFLAGAALALFVAPGRALKSQRGMAASSELRDAAHFGAALRALHHRPLAGAAITGTQITHMGILPGKCCAGPEL